MQFDLVDIRLLVNIAETNSVTHGASRSNMSTPAASVRIKNMEERLGTKLLYRTSHGVTLTPPGEALLHHGRIVLRQLERLRGDLHDYVRGVKGHVRVFANTTAITEFLPAVLRDYLATHPDVSVDLREHLSDDIVRAVSDGTTDIGIVAGGVRTEDLEVLPYREDRLVLVAAADHPLARKKKIAFAETLDFDHVGHQGSAMHAFLQQAAHVAHKPIKDRIQVGNFEALCRMVEANVGIGILPESSASRHGRSLRICIVPLSDPWALRQLEICVRRLDALPAFAKDLVDLLTADAARSRLGRDKSVVSIRARKTPGLRHT
jgi:DNA-binding transcriptional LysR family regulator